jgi:hypothetical protein
MKITGVVLTGLCLVGYISLFLFGAYIISMAMYVFSDAKYIGDIAYIPKWIWALIPLIFLEGKREVRETVERLFNL